MPHARHPTSVLAAVLTLGLLVAMGLAAGTAHAAAPQPAGNGATQSWAYGMQWSGGCTGSSATGFTGNLCFNMTSGSTGNTSITNFGVHVFVGAAVIFTQTNNSPVYYLTIQKALYVYASAQATLTCTSGCGSAPAQTSATVNGTFVAWYSGYGFANVTTASTVNVNGSAVPAIGLLDASASESANATGTASISGGIYSGPNIYASAQVNAQAAATFSPALGLVPTQVNPGLIWNSSSSYTASAAGTYGYHYYIPCMYQSTINANCTTNAATFSTSVAASVPSAASVALQGQDWGSYQVSDAYGTQTFQVITLSFTGALGTTDGVFLVPSSIGGAISAISPVGHALHAGTGLAMVSSPMAAAPGGSLYYSTSGGHVGFSGSSIGSSLYSSASAPSNAVPMDPTAAQSLANGLLTPSKSASSGFAWLLPLVVLAVVVLVIVGAVLYMRRGRHPKTPTATTAAPPAQAAPYNYGAWPAGAPPAAPAQQPYAPAYNPSAPQAPPAPGQAYPPTR